VADTNLEMGLVGRGAGLVLLEAALVWLFYLAVEPYARRLRPWTLVSWTRLLGGGLGDPVVGRDTLIGLAWALLVGLLMPCSQAVPVWLGQPGPEPSMGELAALQGPGMLLSTVLMLAGGAILYSMGVLLLFVLLRLLLRRDALAMAAVAVIWALPSALSTWEAAWISAVVWVAFTVAWILLLLRFGLLAAIVGFFASDLFDSLPLTTDLSSWTAGPTLLAVAIVGLLAVLAFRNATGGLGLRRALAGEAASRP
jgi:hypothetical protein